jgi:predicted amidohydrolase
MKISLIQSDISWNEPAQNVERCTALAHEALASRSEVLIFPEMLTCGFSMPTGSLAAESSQLGHQLLSSIADQHSVYTVGSLPEVATEGKLYNTAWIFGPNRFSAAYRKIHPFAFGGETDPYAPGSSVCTVNLKASSGQTLRTTVLICYDLRFAPLFWAQAPRTDLFIVVANWPAKRREHWLTLLRARAIENQAYVAGVNRVGSGGGLDYSGDSALFAPDGTELGKLGDSQSILTCDVDPASVTSWRATLPALRDRRAELYANLTSE